MKKIIAVIVILAVVFYARNYKDQGLPPEVISMLQTYSEGEIDLKDLPLEQAIKQVQGNGALVLVTFEDPNCPYCADLDKQLARIDNATIYTFLLPILSEDSMMKSRRIWCAPDQTQAWKNWMLEGVEPPVTRYCDTKALDKNLAIRKKMGIRGVPHLLQINK
jgi:thiol:disulfide interchange protein DsbC